MIMGCFFDSFDSIYHDHGMVFWLFWYVYCLRWSFVFPSPRWNRRSWTERRMRVEHVSPHVATKFGCTHPHSGCFCSGWRSNREFHTDPSVVWAPWCKGRHQSYLEAYKATGITFRAPEQWIKIEVIKWGVLFLGMITSLVHPFSPSTKLKHRCDCGRKGAKIYQRALETFTNRAWNLTWHVWLVGAAGWMFGMNLVKLDR